MDLNASASYEFLDLSDIDENERKKLICTLYNNSKTSSSSSSIQEDTIKLNNNNKINNSNNNKNNNFKKKDTTITTTLKRIHQHHTSSSSSSYSSNSNSNSNSSVNGSSSTSFSSNCNTINNNIKEFSNRNSRFINETNNKHVSKNIATIKYPQHLSSSSHEKFASGHIVQNLMIPRLLTPIALPFCALPVIKPRLADVKLVPLRTPIPPVTASAAVKTHAEQGKLFCKPYSGNILNSTTMAQHNQAQHQQQQQQQQPPPPPPQQQQQQLMNTQSPQIQANQSQQALSQNNNYSHSHLAQSHGFNQVPSGGLYMHPHGAQPVSGTFYHLLPAASMPSSSVYVHNVTANVNYHGYPAPSYIPAGTAATQAYIPGESQQNIAHIAEQQNTTTTQTVPNPTGRNPRSRRGRGNAGNNRRNDYSQRQQQPPSPSPQEVLNLQFDPQALGYVQYGYSCPFYGTPQNIAHAQAQQAAGSPLYPISMFTAAGSPMCSYPGMIYQPAMIPQEYSLVDEKGEEHSAEGVLAQPMWPVFYPEDYVGHELVEDVNHNPSPITSSDTPSMLSPSYPIYETSMQPMDLQQQMNAMHICETQPVPQPIVVEESIQNSTMHVPQQQPCEQIVLDNHPPLVPIENNLIVDHHQQQQQQQQQAILMDNTTTTDEKIETILVDDNASMTSISNVPQQYSEQNMTALPIVTENQNVQQLSNNVAVMQPHLTNDAFSTALTDKKDSSVGKDLNQSQNVLISSSDEQQQQQQQKQQTSGNKVVNTASNEHKQTNNEILNVPTSNENSQTRNTSMKTSTWTNQNKKSTASVAVTATPTSANNNNNKSSNLTNNKGANSNTVANLNLNVHQTVQVKNYGVMKTPSSPAATNENNISNSNSSNGNISNNEKKMVQSQPVQNEATGKGISTTSTGSTVIPQHLQENKPTNSVATRNEIKKDSQMSDNAAKIESTESTVKEENSVTNSVQSPPSQGPLSWASLFANKSSTFSNTSSSPSQQLQSNNSIQSKKPVAKVFPFEGTSNFTPPVTPGNMSYSAASAQGLANSQTSINHTNAVKSKPLPSSSNASGTNNRETDEWSLKFADFLSKQKIDYSSTSLRPRGLTNRSNYCYINAILQALVGCSPFYNLMKSIPKQTAALMSEKTNTPTIYAMMQLVAEFSHLPPGTRLNRREKGQQKKDDLYSELSCDPSFEPTAIYKLWNASRSDNEGKQEDAEEFLGYVLNKLNDEMLEVIKLISKPNAEQNGDGNYDADDGGEDWQMIYNNRNKGSITRQTDFGRTPVSDIFRGELRSRLQREGEHSVTDVIQPFFTLQLNIEKAASVKEALEILVGRDQLEGVTCSKTNQEVAAWQQMTLEKLPVVLILHLKWFDYKMDGCTKIIKTVEFPVELRIDTKILASKKYSQKQKLYRLFAVVYHDGKEASKGHYITDVYHTGYSSWLRYDDSSVKPVSENNVLRPRTPRVPYLLYYRRCDTVPVQNAANK